MSSIFSYVSTLLTSLISSLSEFLGSHQTLLDGIKVAAAGIFFETFRRGFSRVVYSVQSCLYLTAHFYASDDAHEWLHAYLTTHAIDRRLHTGGVGLIPTLLEGIFPIGHTPPREVTATTRRAMIIRSYSDVWSPVDAEEVDISQAGVRLTYSPIFGSVHAIKFKGHTLLFRTSSPQDNSYLREAIAISIFMGNHSIIQDLVTQARLEYLERDQSRISIFTAQASKESRWGKCTTKPVRPWDSVILPSDVKDGLLADAREFLEERDFYLGRGLPYRRGYLLYGTPGSGKSSLIAAIASRLSLDIYIVDLTAKSIDDAYLHTLLIGCPSRSILLLEDIDCAFTDREKPESENAKTESGVDKKKDPEKTKDKAKEKSNSQDNTRVTLSGLLNAIDGVASSEGRLLFCTTNHIDQIDPALSRPGRCDVWVGFTYATRDQAYQLFLHFYGVQFVENDTIRSDHAVSDTKSLDNQPSTESAKSRVTLEAARAAADSVIREKPEVMSLDSSVATKELAQRFATTIPVDKLSVSALTAYLMRFKRKPLAAVEGLESWIADGCPQRPTSNVMTTSTLANPVAI